MALRTAFTELVGIEHPIALAPMGGSAGGALAAAVSNGGGLGLVGAGYGDLTWLDREPAIVAERTDEPWGVGFLSWAAPPAAVERALDRWRGRGAELEADGQARADHRAAAGRGDLSAAPVWAGEAIDLITDLPPAADLVSAIAAEAEDALLQAGRRIVT